MPLSCQVSFLACFDPSQRLSPVRLSLSCGAQEIKVIEKRVEETRVALQHLEMHLINTACDDPGTSCRGGMRG